MYRLESKKEGSYITYVICFQDSLGDSSDIETLGQDEYIVKVKINADNGQVVEVVFGSQNNLINKIYTPHEVQQIINTNLTAQQTDKHIRTMATFSLSTLLSVNINGCDRSCVRYIGTLEKYPSTEKPDAKEDKIKKVEDRRNIIKEKLSTIIQSNQSKGGILLVPCPLVGEKGGLHMTLAVIDLANKEFAIFDSNIHSEENDCQYTDAREKIQIEGFENVGLLNSGEKAFKPQTQFNDCTYWVEATILVLSEIISKNPEITLDGLSEQLMDKKVQNRICKKHNKILQTNKNIDELYYLDGARDIGDFGIEKQDSGEKNEPKQTTNNGFGDFDTTEQNSTTPPVPQSNITEKTSKTEQTTNTSTPEHTDDNNDLKAVAKRFSPLSSSTATRCQDNKNATPQSATVNIPPSETQGISRPQPVPSIE